MITLTRRMLLASPIAGALPTATPTPPPELVAACRRLARACDLVRDRDTELERLKVAGDPAAARVFEDGPLAAATAELGRADQAALAEAFGRAGLAAVAVDGRLYASLWASLGADLVSEPPIHTLAFDLGRVAGGPH